MGRRTASIPLEKLRELYIDKHLSSYEIGEQFSCSDQSIRNKLREAGILLRTGGRKKFKYKKLSFDGGDMIKAYMVGFRIGDLNVYKPYQNSRILVVRCHTTIVSQIDVIRVLFERYGKVEVSPETKNGSYHVNVYLNQSFDFLMDKTAIPNWIQEGAQEIQWAFIAGYVDAEGSFKLNQGRGRFKIDAYDHFVLVWIDDFLQKERINGKFRRICEKGEIKYASYVWKDDLWRLEVNSANCLDRFIKGMMPYLLHADRIKDAIIVLNNINERKQNGTVKSY